MKRMIWWVPIFTLLLLGGARPAGGQAVSQLNPLDSPDSQPAALQQSCLEANCSYLPQVGSFRPDVDPPNVELQWAIINSERGGNQPE